MKATFDAEIRAMTLKPEKGEVLHRTAVPTLVVQLNSEDDCRHLFGAELARIIWGRAGEDGKIRVDQIKPRLIVGVHLIKVDIEEFRSCPVYDKVMVDKDGESVELHIKMPFSYDRYLGAMMHLAGRLLDPITVAIEPVQQELELEDREGGTAKTHRKVRSVPTPEQQAAPDKMDKQRRPELVLPKE